MRSERLLEFLYRHRYAALALIVLHLFLAHALVLGFLSWDGFGHRGYPIVEWAKYGDMNKWKFNEWSLTGYIPFLELVHVPFLLAFGMRGFLIGFPLVLFPLCVVAVYLLIRELTSDRRAGLLGALAYLAMPMVNQQPFTAYVDFAVTGVLAYFLYAFVRAARDERPLAPFVRLLLATFLSTMARPQAVYVLAILAVPIGYALFCERAGMRVRVVARRKLWLSAAVIALGAAPAIGQQIYRYVELGSPIAPMQLSLFGVKIGTGVSLDQYFQYAGLGGTDPASLARGFFEGWIWKLKWPIGAFYASTHMGAGLVFWVALALAPVFWKHASRTERWLVVGAVVVAIVAKDFAVPRVAYTTMIAIAVVIGRGLAVLASAPRGRVPFWLAFGVLALHLLRPEVDYLQIRDPQYYVSPRLNVSGTPWFVRGRDDVRLHPDRHQRLFILETTGNNFILQLYGRNLSNQILGTIRKDAIGPRCAGLWPATVMYPDALFVDELGLSNDCERECAMSKGQCLWWRIKPSR
jgi:hypothetical protein